MKKTSGRKTRRNQSDELRPEYRFDYKKSRPNRFAGGTSEDLFKYVGLLFGVVAWWFAHSSALLKLAGTSTPLTVKDARAISASVFGYLFGALFALALVVVVIALVVGAMK